MLEDQFFQNIQFDNLHVVLDRCLRVEQAAQEEIIGNFLEQCEYTAVRHIEEFFLVGIEQLGVKVEK